MHMLEENRATVTGNIYRKCGEVQTWFLRYACKNQASSLDLLLPFNIKTNHGKRRKLPKLYRIAQEPCLKSIEHFAMQCSNMLEVFWYL